LETAPAGPFAEQAWLPRRQAPITKIVSLDPKLYQLLPAVFSISRD
jgi:hypothetical protein